MISASKSAGCLPALELTYRVRSMTASIQQQVQPAIPVAHQENRLQPHPARDELARLGNFAFVSDIGPDAREDSFHLVTEDRIVVVETRMDLVFPDELPVIDRSGRHLHMTSG